MCSSTLEWLLSAGAQAVESSSSESEPEQGKGKAASAKKKKPKKILTNAQLSKETKEVRTHSFCLSV